MGGYVITLVADSARQKLSDSEIREFSQSVDASRWAWLREGEAADLWVESGEWRVNGKGKLDAFLLTHYPPPNTNRDYIAQPADNRLKKMLISDMDSTMITVECIDELADFVGKKSEVAEITDRAMNGELDFEAALIARVALLAGLPESTLQTCYDERVRMMPGARELVSGMRESGAHCVLVSGGFTFFTARVAAELGFHEHYANVLEVRDGTLTGRVTPPILGKEAKLATLRQKAQELNISAEDVLAVGDGANDLPMLLAAGLGVAYHAKPRVQEQARHRINHCDLRALLYAQGLTRRDQ